MINDLRKEDIESIASTEPMQFDAQRDQIVCKFCGSHGSQAHEADCQWVACKNAVASWREGNGD